MKIAVPGETASGENRVALVPTHVKKLIDLGCEVTVEKDCGKGSGFSDTDYREAGAKIGVDQEKMLAAADIVLRLNKPDTKDLKPLGKGTIHISYLDPLNEHAIVKALVRGKISAISMEFIPRTTLAQKMDVLSSQANLAGYVAVIVACERLRKIMPMMMTPAGTIPPARVFVIGAGVAGLQAVATARRLGARVEAFDTRPVVEEQVTSLGAKFVKVDLGETGETKNGYAKALTDEQLSKQRETMARHCALADVVVTTAQVFGRKAPLIVTKDMIKNMKSGSIIVDLAVETGGNVEGTVLDKEIRTRNGVLLIGLGRMPNRVADHASLMYSSNVYNLIEHFWNKEDKKLDLNLDDEIMNGCLIVHDGEIRNQMVKDSIKEGE